MSARGEASTQGKAPSPPPLRFLLCFYNLWLEAVQHSILSLWQSLWYRGEVEIIVFLAEAVWIVEINYLAPQLLIHNTHTNTHTLPLPPSSHQLRQFPAGGLSVRDTEEHAIYLGNNHFTRHHTYRQCRVKSPGSSGASCAAPVFSFVPPLNWYWMVPQRDTACITVGAALNHSLDRIGSRDLSQQLRFHFIRCISFH